MNKQCLIKLSNYQKGFHSLYLRSPGFYYQMALSRGDGSYGKIMNKLSKTSVLIIDDFGIAPLTDTERRDLFEVVDEKTRARINHHHQSATHRKLA